MGFASVLGHERVKGLLGEAVRRGRMPPAVLLSGPQGVGKRLLALATARALVCERGAGDACEVCGHCARATRGVHPDVRLVEPETRVLKIDQVRDVVREVLARPFEARARAFVIDEAHTLTDEAGNALLKSLEEPPPTSHLILVTASPQALLPTIRSRCQSLRLGPLPAPLLEAHLREQAGLAPAEARLRAALAGGSLGAALAFESDAYRALRDELLGVLATVEGRAVVEGLQASERLADAEDPMLAMTVLRSLLRDLMALRAGAPPEALLNADAVEHLVPLASGPLGERAATLAEAAAVLRDGLQGNANRLLSMDVLVDVLGGSGAPPPWPSA